MAGEVRALLPRDNAVANQRVGGGCRCLALLTAINCLACARESRAGDETLTAIAAWRLVVCASAPATSARCPSRSTDVETCFSRSVRDDPVLFAYGGCRRRVFLAGGCVMRAGAARALSGVTRDHCLHAVNLATSGRSVRPLAATPRPLPGDNR